MNSYADNFPGQPTPNNEPIFLSGYHIVEGVCPACSAVNSHIHTNADGSIIVFPTEDDNTRNSSNKSKKNWGIIKL